MKSVRNVTQTITIWGEGAMLYWGLQIVTLRLDKEDWIQLAHITVK
jgi:hypothetical protein